MSQAETNKYEKLIAECDLLISQGKIASVGPLIAKLTIAQVPRAYRTALAKICRRAGLVTYGLRLLHPVLRNDQPLALPPSASEICEYSVLLSRNGSINEALELLKGVDPKRSAEALLYQGFCHVSSWDYAAAKQYFERFLASGASDYEKLIARVNMVPCAIATDDLTAAEELVEQSLSIATQANAKRLMGNCHELRAQIHVLKNRFNEAQSDLSKALEIFKDNGSYDELFIHKWQSVIESFKKNSFAPISAFRAEAQARKHWESVREADYYRLRIRFDQNLFDHLVFGTPHVAYRRRIETQLGRSPSQFFVWGDASSSCLDLKTGKIGDREALNSGKMIHQVLSVLAKDFYAPRSTGVLFADLYANEYFDVNTSPLRIRQLLKRTRAWLKSEGLPAAIEEIGGSYRLVLDKGMGFKIPLLREGRLSSQQALWETLLSHFNADIGFTGTDATERLNISRSTFHRLAEWALKDGKLSKTGVGKATVYRLTQGESVERSRAA